MKLLVATPAYGGMLTSQYLQSVVATISGCIGDGQSFSIYTLENESLISRARNKCAMHALTQGYDKLLFIDSDMIWNYADFKKVISSNKWIIGGTYPVKAYPITLNYNTLPDNEYFNDVKTPESFKLLGEKYSNFYKEIEVQHVPTGFMAINCDVFRKLINEERVQPYQSLVPETREVSQCYDFFPVRVRDGQLESEDWAFCSISREAGIPVYLHSEVVLGHTGFHHYKV